MYTIKLLTSLIKCSVSCKIEQFNWTMVKIQISFKYTEFHVNYFYLKLSCIFTIIQYIYIYIYIYIFFKAVVTTMCDIFKVTKIMVKNKRPFCDIFEELLLFVS